MEDVMRATCSVFLQTKNWVDSFYHNEESQSASEKHIVLWSGGCDSSLLLYELLKAYGKENVVAVSYSYPWLFAPKCKAETLHRAAFKSKLALRGFPDIQHTHITVDKEDYHTQLEAVAGGLPQAIGWLFQIFPYCLSNTAVYHGVVKGDCLPLWIQDYEAIVRHTAKILQREIRFRTPYIEISKPEIIERLIMEEMLEECWFCEVPRENGKYIDACFECTTCRTHINGLLSLQYHTRDAYVKKYVNKRLAKINDVRQDYNPEGIKA